MHLTDISVLRPVLATVSGLLILLFGILAYFTLPLSEYPDVSTPIVSIRTDYPGAPASTVEEKITAPIEAGLSGIDSIRSISSSSQEGLSRITVEFNANRDIDSAANDVREKVSRLLSRLPEDVRPPQVFKSGMYTYPTMRLTFISDRMSSMDLTDYAERYIVDQLAVVDGVAEVSISGERTPSMKITIDPDALVARGLTVTDVAAALERSDPGSPAGKIESQDKEFTLRFSALNRTETDFYNMVIGRGVNGHLIRLGEVATVERAPRSERSASRQDGREALGIGIVKQPQANTLDISKGIRARLETLAETLPEGSELFISSDDADFINASINEVYQTLFIIILMVIAVIYIFLRDFRATLIPAVTVPVSLIGAFAVLALFGYSLNLLTLLALTLSVGLVVDDSIVVLENVHRRLREGESLLMATFAGARQVAFPVIVTSLVLVAVFVPIVLIEGDVGRLFTELAVTIVAAVIISTFVALGISPAMCSLLLVNEPAPGGSAATEKTAQPKFWSLERLRNAYIGSLEFAFAHYWWFVGMFVAVLIGIAFLFENIRQEYIPKEDRGLIFIFTRGPEGANFDYMRKEMNRLEAILMKHTEAGEIRAVQQRIPGWGGGSSLNSGVFVINMAPWDEREHSSAEISRELMAELRREPGLLSIPILPSGIPGATSSDQSLQIVLAGRSYEALARWQDVILEEAAKNPNLQDLESDYSTRRPQLAINIDRERSADLGVSIEQVSRTLELMLGERAVTTYSVDGREYDVLMQVNRASRQDPGNIGNYTVRSTTTGDLIPLSNLIRVESTASAGELQRYNRARAITLTANLAPGYSMGEAIAYFENLIRTELPDEARIDYKGETLKYKESSKSSLFILLFAIAIVFLLLAAQFEDFVQPIIIMLTVPLALLGALLSIYYSDTSINIYSQIGFVMLVGIATKNGILIVEFANRLREEGQSLREALINASAVRFRPILMTTISTVFGAIPLVMATGPGEASRYSLGLVIFFGVSFGTFMTLYIVPVFSLLLSNKNKVPGARVKQLQQELRQAE